MGKIHKGTTLAVLLNLVGLICIFFGYHFPAAFLSLIAYFAAMKEVAKYTSLYQFVTVFLSSLVLGIALELPILHFPFLTLSLFFAAAGSITRMAFFKLFSYTGYSWWEPVLLAASSVLYVYANLSDPASWQQWTLPLPVLIFNATMCRGILKDKSALFANARGGYRVKIGNPAADFELPDQNGDLVKLSDFKNTRHLLLVFVRGDWCPGCHMMLRTYEKNNVIFQKKNIYVMAIGPDPKGVNREMVEKLGLDFKVLSDENQKTAMNYGVQMKEYNNSFAQSYQPGIPLPASFLIDRAGIVRYVSRPDKVGEFLNPSLIFPIIEQLT